MKLKTKLIPLASVAVTAAALAPQTLASCGSSKHISLQEINSPDEARPTFDPYSATPSAFSYDKKKTTAEQFAIDNYIAFIKEDPERFVQDMKWGIYQNWLSFYDNSDFLQYMGTNLFNKYDSTLNSLKVGIEDVKFSTVNIVPPGAGTAKGDTYNTVSFKMRIDVEAEVKTLLTSIGGSGQTQQTTSRKIIKASTDVQYKNMIFFAYPAARNNKIAIMAQNDSRVTTEKLNPTQPVNTDGSGWWITISDEDPTFSSSPYNYDYEDWGITYDSDITIDETSSVNGEDETHTVQSYNVANNVNTPSKLRSLVNLKSYNLNNSFEKEGYVNMINWFNQSPVQIVANSVLMDTVSYYYTNNFVEPTVKKTGDGTTNVSDLTILPHGSVDSYNSPHFDPSDKGEDPPEEHPDDGTWRFGESRVTLSGPDGWTMTIDPSTLEGSTVKFPATEYTEDYDPETSTERTIKVQPVRLYLGQKAKEAGEKNADAPSVFARQHYIAINCTNSGMYGNWLIERIRNYGNFNFEYDNYDVNAEINKIISQHSTARTMYFYPDQDGCIDLGMYQDQLIRPDGKVVQGNDTYNLYSNWVHYNERKDRQTGEWIPLDEEWSDEMILDRPIFDNVDGDSYWKDNIWDRFCDNAEMYAEYGYSDSLQRMKNLIDHCDYYYNYDQASKDIGQGVGLIDPTTGKVIYPGVSIRTDRYMHILKFNWPEDAKIWLHKATINPDTGEEEFIDGDDEYEIDLPDKEFTITYYYEIGGLKPHYKP